MNSFIRQNRWGPVLVVALYFGVATLFAQAPAWWTNRNLIVTNAVPRDFAPLNQGQLKWLATQAAAEFDEKLQALGGAGSNITALVASFTNANNYHPVNAGQLKNTVAPFYDRLLALDLTNCYPPGAATPYPWSGHTGPVNDYALINAGQAKYVFSFDLEGVDITTETDTDNDGLPDWWEMQHFGNRTAADPAADPDEDGWDNLFEFLMQTEPFKQDTDGDGIPDNLDAKPLNPEQDNPIVFVVDGEDGGQDVVIQDHKQYKIPKGTAKIALTVVVFSREWPYYTGEQSQFNDVVTYSIMGSAGTMAQGSYMVNDLHDDFADGEYPGGNWKAKDQEWIDVSALTANGSATIDITASAKNVNDNLLGSGVAVKISVLRVDLDGDNEDDGDVDDEDDAKEEALPVIVAINEDTRELTVRKVGVSSGGTLKIKRTGAGKITLKKSGGETVLGESDSESVDILADAEAADLVLTLDGIELGNVDLELEFSSDGFACSDQFKVKVVRSDIVQRTGDAALAALIGEVRTHSGIHSKDVTHLYHTGIETVPLTGSASFESGASSATDWRRLRVKKGLYMARRVWAKVHDNMEACAYALPASGVHPWNVFSTATNYTTANCNEFVKEQFRRAVFDVHAELTKPPQQTAFETQWYDGGAVVPLTPGKHLVRFPGPVGPFPPSAALLIAGLELTLDVLGGCCWGVASEWHNEYEGGYLTYWYWPLTATKYTAGALTRCPVCGVTPTTYPTIPWYSLPFAELWKEAHHSTITPDGLANPYFEDITY